MKKRLGGAFTLPFAIASACPLRCLQLFVAAGQRAPRYVRAAADAVPVEPASTSMPAAQGPSRARLDRFDNHDADAEVFHKRCQLGGRNDRFGIFWQSANMPRPRDSTCSWRSVQISRQHQAPGKLPLPHAVLPPKTAIHFTDCLAPRCYVPYPLSARYHLPAAPVALTAARPARRDGNRRQAGLPRASARLGLAGCVLARAGCALRQRCPSWGASPSRASLQARSARSRASCWPSPCRWRAFRRVSCRCGLLCALAVCFAHPPPRPPSRARSSCACGRPAPS